MKHVFLFSLLLSLFLVSPAHAGECWAEPYYEVNGTATVRSGVFMRNGPCQSGTDVVATAPTGAAVTVLAENHGWYLIRLANGQTGWSYQSFLNTSGLSLSQSNRAAIESAYPTGLSGPEVTEHKKHEPKQEPVAKEPEVKTIVKPLTGPTLYDRVKGRILLQVEDNGEAWYVNPADRKRYYMKDGPTAYEMMRKFGLGISNADLTKLQGGDVSLINQLRGRIVLQVEAHGEAFYIHPDDGKTHYLKDGEAAYSIMRFLSLGVTNKDLSLLSKEDFTPLATLTSAPAKPTPTSNPSTIVAQSAPSNVDTVALNQYWLDKVNSLRAAKGLHPLVLDQRWVETATRYADYMKEAQAFAHERPDGSSMHQWIDQQGLEFTTRHAPGGWVTNYFTENISWGHSDNSMAGMKKVLDQTMDFYEGEASYNGPHYRTTYHEDWNSVGAGFAFENMNGKGKVYAVFHYGSLVLK